MTSKHESWVGCHFYHCFTKLKQKLIRIKVINKVCEASDANFMLFCVFIAAANIGLEINQCKTKYLYEVNA